MALQNGYLIDADHFDGIPTSVVVNNVVMYSRDIGANGRPDLTLEEYLQENDLQNPQVLTRDELEARIKAWEQIKYLDQPPREIDAEEFDEMLNALPPLNRHSKDGIERFCMSEMTTGTITSQYARAGDRYLCKHVDIKRPDTWITRDDFDALSPRTTGLVSA